MPNIIDSRLKFPCCKCNRKQGRAFPSLLSTPVANLLQYRSIGRGRRRAVYILYIFALSEFALNSGAKWGRDRGVSLTPNTLAAFDLSFGNCVVDFLPRSFILKCSERTYDSVHRGLGGTAAFT